MLPPEPYYSRKNGTVNRHLSFHTPNNCTTYRFELSVLEAGDYSFAFPFAGILRQVQRGERYYCQTEKEYKCPERSVVSNYCIVNRGKGEEDTV